MALGWKILLVLTLGVLHAREMEGVDFAEQIESGGTKLVLNGTGLRNKRKFGMNFKVYVAGLYLPAKSDKAPEIIASDEPKLMRMVFLRSIDADTLIEGYDDSYAKNCKPNCESAKTDFEAFKKLLPNVKDKSEFRVQITKDVIAVDFNGTKGTITSKPFSKILLSMFIGEEPPTEDLKRGLLGH